MLEYIPKYGQRLAEEVRKWGEWVKEQAEKELAQFYPKDADGSTPIAYLWARTIKCEGPGCGAEVPLLRSLWLAKQKNRSIAMRLVPNLNQKRVEFEIDYNVKGKDVGDGTIRRGSPTCPCCSYTTPVASVRTQLKARKGGANDARLFAVVTTRPSEQGRFYRLSTDADLQAASAASDELQKRSSSWREALSLVPDEPLPPQGTLGFRVQLYGMLQWGDLFTPRQLLSLTTLGRYVREAGNRLAKENDEGLAEAVQAFLGLAMSRLTDIFNSLCMWETTKTQVRHLFTRQAVPMLWDFAEPPLSGDAAGDFTVTLSTMLEVCNSFDQGMRTGTVAQASAIQYPLPDDSCHAVITDPPYYDAVPYADLSDFFYVWLKRVLPPSLSRSFKDTSTPKAGECIVDSVKGKDGTFSKGQWGLLWRMPAES